jgi:hypothetical protein
MRISSSFLLAVLSLPFPGAQAYSAESPPPAASPALSQVAMKYAKKHEALAQRFASKRKAMVEDPAWKSLSAEQQKAKLDALDADFKDRDSKIADAEAAARKQGGNVEQAKAQQQQAAQLDQVKIQAVQDERANSRNP